MRRLRLAALGVLLAACSVASPSATTPQVTQPSTQTPSVPTLAPTPTVAPTTTAVPSQTPTHTWQLVPIPPMFAGGWAMPVALAAGDSGIVAVGGREFRDPEAPAGATAGAWRSDDGLTWEPANPKGLAVGDFLPESGPPAGLVDVAWGPGGFVAVGNAFAEADGEPTVVGGAWYSADGRSWARSTSRLWALARPAAITWSGTHFVVVGVVEEDAAPRAAVWYSPDGLAWKRAPDTPAFDVGTYLDTMEYHAWGGPKAVTSNEDGVLYAVGLTCQDSAEPGDAICEHLVWRSEDATTWTREGLGQAANELSLQSIAAVGGLVVAVGGPRLDSGTPGADPARVVVRGSDSWKRVEPPGMPRLAHVVPFGTGFAAVSGTALWVSVTGEVWTPVIESPAVNVQAFDVTQVGALLVGVGWTTGYPDDDENGFAVIWTPAAR